MGDEKKKKKNQNLLKDKRRKERKKSPFPPKKKLKTNDMSASCLKLLLDAGIENTKNAGSPLI